MFGYKLVKKSSLEPVETVAAENRRLAQIERRLRLLQSFEFPLVARAAKWALDPDGLSDSEFHELLEHERTYGRKAR